MTRYFYLPLLALLSLHTLCGCKEKKSSTANETSALEKEPDQPYTEGKDYLLYERIRTLDKTGFTEPQEAYSMLLPKGWSHEDEIVWNTPGSPCEGTFRWLKAKSADGRYNFEMFPDIIYIWNTHPDLMQFNQNNEGASPNCATGEPMDAEQYLRNVFAKDELGNPEILKVASNQYVVDQMKQANEASMRELAQYGAGQMQFHQTAVTANVRWADGRDGWVVLGANMLETVVPNVYDGTSTKMFTTQVTKRIVFKYPSTEKEQAENQFSVLMGSFRTNPAWNDAVTKFWRDARQQKHIAHLGKIKMMDDQTRRMGEQAIKNGENRLRSMDVDLRNWEERQNSQDRMHTNFIKTIREVENYQDEAGKFELTSGYDHAWSRGDGNSFVMSNDPNFDPAFVLKDQNWKEMKKVD